MVIILNLILALSLNSCEMVASTMNFEIQYCINYYKTCVKTDTGFDCYMYYDENPIPLKDCKQVAVANNVAYSTCENLECMSSANLNGIFLSCCNEIDNCQSIIKEKDKC